MIVKELIEELSNYPQDLVVIVSTQEESFEPVVQIKKYDFDTSYSADRGRVTLPKNVSFVEVS